MSTGRKRSVSPFSIKDSRLKLDRKKIEAKKYIETKLKDNQRTHTEPAETIVLQPHGKSVQKKA